MKKIVLMLMAMVVFGNVLGASWIENPIEVKTVHITYGTNGDVRVLFSPMVYVPGPGGNDGIMMWYEYIGINSTTISDNEKAIMSLLLSAKASGAKVTIYDENQSGQIRMYKHIATVQ